jgi:hypothetical protein
LVKSPTINEIDTMTNKLLTALIIRLAGFALFIKIFDFFGSYFMSIYMTTQLSIFEKTTETHYSFNSLFLSGSFLAFANLFLSVLLIIKSDWIANKLVKSDSDIKFDLSVNTIMKIIIATIGIVYCAQSLYTLSTSIENVIYTYYKNDEKSTGVIVAVLSKYFIKLVIGVFFIYKSDKISKFLLRKMNSHK